MSGQPVQPRTICRSSKLSSRRTGIELSLDTGCENAALSAAVTETEPGVRHLLSPGVGSH